MKCNISYPQETKKWTKETEGVLFLASHSTVSKFDFVDLQVDFANNIMFFQMAKKMNEYVKEKEHLFL